ncbi:MAG TPA: hypothetical protein VFI52_02570 [Gemmatimonadaceae bacterium]|nr:hypothetical protein [Gemmatimonadaceae bacterium]
MRILGPVYTTCLFCNQPLGANEVLEAFPVGRRLAFDADKGRLWVVCPHCERWNLTPFEERWEAIEQAERSYRDTRLRVSTENIGLARLPEGLELVRIGRPERPEIAAWRYGDQFGRRRRRRLITAGVVATGGALIVAGGVAAGLGMIAVVNLGRAARNRVEHGFPSATVARLRDEHGVLLRIQRRHLTQSRIATGRDGGLALDLEHSKGRVLLEGADAHRAAATLFPAVNHFGGTREEVQRAVGRLEFAGGSERYLQNIARSGHKLTTVVSNKRQWISEPSVDVHDSGLMAIPASVRLAIEMALHEEQERRALEGELAELERAWRDAEEIGAIADSLLLPAWVEDALKRLR